MINFRQKEFAEHDAMRAFYMQLQRERDYRSRPEIISRDSLIPILKGNNIVIERFVISTSMFGKDKYRMYLKMGAKVKMPDSVRLTSHSTSRPIGKMSISMSNSFGGGGGDNKKKDNNNNNNNNNNNQKNYSISSSFTPYIDISSSKTELLGDTVVYDKSSRTLVLEFRSISDAIRALDILPFGLGYKLYLLDS